MSKETIEQLQEDIKESYEYFDNEHHFNEVFEMAGWDEDYMRIFDCGYIKGIQSILSKLQEKYQKNE